MTNAKQRYKAKVVKLQVDLFPTDKDIIDQLQKIGSKATYIKRLIRDDTRKTSRKTTFERTMEGVVNSFHFGLSPFGQMIYLSIANSPYLWEVNVLDIHRGGENGEMDSLRIGSKVTIEYHHGMGGHRCVDNLIIQSNY